MALNDYETADESGATTDTGSDPRLDEGASGVDSSLEPLGGYAVELPPKMREFISERPMAAALASAAVGAGLVALLLLVTREDSSPRARVASGIDTATDGFASLRAQVADLASMLAASLPSRGDVSDAVDGASSAAQDRFATLREQTQEMIEKLRPYVGATADMARANPVWTAVAVGALGALLGSQLLGGGAAEEKPEATAA